MKTPRVIPLLAWVLLLGVLMALPAAGQVDADLNGDSSTNAADVIYLAAFLFANGPAPMVSADFNGDAVVDVIDLFHFVNALFFGGPGQNVRAAANPQSVDLNEDVATGITLTGTDPENDPFTFELRDLPTRGTLSGTPPNLTYTPDLNETGSDSFTFVVIQNSVPSAPATVTLQIQSVNDPPITADTSFQAMGNVSMDVLAPGLLKNSSDPDSILTVKNPGPVDTSPAGGRATLNADGSFHYIPPSGFTGGPVTFQYQITDGLIDSPMRTATLNVAGRALFVHLNNSFSPRDGRMSDAAVLGGAPFATLEEASAASLPGDEILVLCCSDRIAGSIALKDNQKLIGAGVAENYTVTLNGNTIVLVPNTGSIPIQINVGTAVTLATNNTVRGFRILAIPGNGIFGSNVGNVRITEIEAVVAQGGFALDLTNGTLDGSISEIQSESSPTDGLRFTNMNGTLLSNHFNSRIRGAGINSVWISGGSLSLSATMYIDHDVGANALLLVSDGHSGALIVNPPDGLTRHSASTGTGLRFTNADGFYSIGRATLNGGSAALAITNDSSGTFGFPDLDIENPAATAFSIQDSAPNVIFQGDMSMHQNFYLMDIANQTGGSIQMTDGNQRADAGPGVRFLNAHGTFRMLHNPTSGHGFSLDGTAATIQILNSDGNITFENSAQFFPQIRGGTGSGPAILVQGGSPTVRVDGSVSISTNATLVVENTSNANVTINADLSTTFALPLSTGIQIRNNFGSSVTLTNPQPMILRNGSSGAITLENNPGSTLRFAGGHMQIDSAGHGFKATGGGTVIVEGNDNTINVTGPATALEVLDTNIGPAGLNFFRVSSNGSSGAPDYGIRLMNTGALGGLNIQGGGLGGGDIRGYRKQGVSLVNTQAVTIADLGIRFPAAGPEELEAVCTDLVAGTNLNCNAGMHLHNVRNVTLDRVIVDQGPQIGINGNNVENFRMINTQVRSFGNEGLEGSMQFANLTGTCEILGNNGHVVDGFLYDLRVVNTTPVPLNLTISETPFRFQPSGAFRQHVLVSARQSSDINVTINGVFFENGTHKVRLESLDDARLTYALLNNGTQFETNAITIQGGSTQPTRGTISGNNFLNMRGGTDLISTGSGAFIAAVTGNNHAGTLGGIVARNQGTGPMELLISGNTLDGFPPQGPFPGGADAILVESNSTGTLCADIEANTTIGSWVRSITALNSSGFFRLPDYLGAPLDFVGVQDFLAAQNSENHPVVASSPSPNGFTGGAPCASP